jgi:hypothetical protein
MLIMARWALLLAASLFFSLVYAGVPPIIKGEPAPLLADDIIRNITVDYSSYAVSNLTSAKLRRRLDKSDYLRILPLGASITQGYLSSSGNGYRKPLRDKLRSEGWKVNMVGTKRDGNMTDNASLICLAPDHGTSILTSVCRTTKGIRAL